MNTLRSQLKIGSKVRTTEYKAFLNATRDTWFEITDINKDDIRINVINNNIGGWWIHKSAITEINNS